MKKTSPKQYAEALFQALAGEGEKKTKEIIKNFARLLVKKNGLAKEEKIIMEFENIWNRENGVLKAEAVSSFSLAPATVKEIKEYLKKKEGVKAVELSEKIDPALLGGLVLRYKDKILDGSLKTRISCLTEKLAK